MALYFKDIEITNIDNLVPQTGLDITDIWLGEINLYTVWATYEGTLPATINANGSDMRQYKIYGNLGGVGDVIENLWNTNTNAQCYVNIYTGEFVNNDKTTSGAIIPCVPNTTYTVTKFGSSNRFRICSYSAYPVNGDIGDVLFNSDSADYATFTTPSDASYFVIYVDYSSMAISPPKTPQLTVFPSTAPMSVFAQTCCAVSIDVKSGNIYNTDEITWSANGTILDDDGNPTSAGSHYTTNFTAAKPETSYYLSGTFRSGVSTNRIYFYDENKNWISRSAQIDTRAVRTFTTPENCKFIQIQASNDVRSTADWYIKEGTTPPDKYQPYSNMITPIYIGDDPLEKDEYVDYTEQKVYRRTANLFDKNATDTNNGYVSGAYIKSNGKLQNSSAWFVSEYIPVNAEEQYTVVYGSQSSSRAGCYYDINKNYISGANYSGLSTKETITTPSTCAYARFSLVLDAEDVITVTSGTTPPETYVLYYQPIDPPVPLPALPTCEGETVVDYAGQSVAPEKALLKYRKKNF